MTLPRRQFLHLAACAGALPAASRIAGAQAYPTRPITVVVPFAPGGLADLIGRIVADGMRTWLGQSLIIDVLQANEWVILDQFRMAVFCCCCRCGHVGNALALSIMSTAILDAR